MSAMVRQGNAFMREGMSLVPVGPADAAALQRMRQGQHVWVRLWLDRNPAALRRWRALLAQSAPHTRFESPDNLSDIVKLMIGFSDPMELPGGRIAFVPRSTSPAETDQIEFSEILHRAEEFVATHILNADVEPLRREAEIYLAAEARARFTRSAK